MKRLLSIFTLTVCAASAFGQGAPQTGISAAMIKMFGDTKVFDSKAEVRLLDKDQKETSSIPMTMSLRDGKLRSEVNLAEAKMAGLPPDAVPMLKQAGMDKMVTLVQPDKKVTAMIYPNIQSYAEIPAEEDTTGAVESKELGEEKIGTHTCKKVKLTSTDAKGKIHEATVWQAKDLKNFPIQMEMKQKSDTVVVKFQDPKFEAPPASQFELPASYTKYPNFQGLMQAAMMKMFSNGAK